MELIHSKRQKVWGWPAVANFILGGAGAGLYLLSILCELLTEGPLPGSARILGPVLVCIGFLSLTSEAGRPSRGVYLLRNLRRSWISIEVLSGGIFIVAATLDYLHNGPIFHIVAASAAGGLAVSQGFIIYRAKGMTAWNVPGILPIFLFSAFASGGGLLLILASIENLLIEANIVMMILIFLMLDMAAWTIYLTGSLDSCFIKSTAFLHRSIPLFFVLGLGRIFPISIIAGLMIIESSAPASGFGRLLLVLAGISILAGAACQKMGIMLSADFFRDVGLPDAKRGM